MSIRQGDVVVRQIPEDCNEKQKRNFLRDVRCSVDVDRPRMVLDCSNVHRLDRSMVLLMLGCLEEAMKRHGDVRLAALPDETRTLLEMTGVGRLFEIYDTTADAVSGYHQFPDESILQAPISVGSDQESGNAA